MADIPEITDGDILRVIDTMQTFMAEAFRGEREKPDAAVTWSAYVLIAAGGLYMEMARLIAGELTCCGEMGHAQED